MLGDTALYNPGNESNYGKGLYIYHVRDGCVRPSGDIAPQDMECADGYFQWSLKGEDAVYLDCNTISGFKVFEREYPLYDNDSSRLHRRTLKGDGLSLHYFLYTNPFNIYDSISTPVRFGIGQKPSSNCNVGTDRLFTNSKEVYSNFEHRGDRFDAWQPGYNEVFSPYSSPSTCGWDNTYTGIFVWYSGTDHDRADLKIYRDKDAGGETEIGAILEATPPSRPMGIKLDTCYNPGSGYNRIKITWNHNMEPDMNRTIGESIKKRYKIYRSKSADSSGVPMDALAYSEYVYSLLATVDIDSGTAPFYIDTSNCYAFCNELPDQSCPPTCWQSVNVRYRVQAIDVYEDASTLSDFASCRAYVNNPSGTPSGDEDSFGKPRNDIKIPTKFDLYQNYPNPFNPTTNIQYDLPKDNFVTIKIFDVLGKQVAELINEFKPAGSYLISFDGSKLSSGVYFYKIETRDFVLTKRMLLLK